MIYLFCKSNPDKLKTAKVLHFQSIIYYMSYIVMEKMKLIFCIEIYNIN